MDDWLPACGRSRRIKADKESGGTMNRVGRLTTVLKFVIAAKSFIGSTYNDNNNNDNNDTIIIIMLRQNNSDNLQYCSTSLEVAFQNGLRLTVHFSRESWPYCRQWFQKLTILSTMVSKVDRTVDSCIIFQKIATVATIFCGFRLIDFNGKVASKSPNLYKMASESQKISVKVNSQLHGRSEMGS